MTAHRSLRLAVLLVALVAALTLAADKLHPQKYFGRTLSGQSASRPYHPSLDEIYTSSDVPRAIPDGPNGLCTSTLTIPDAVPITDLNVMVSITHPWIRDLRISLIAPDSTEVVLLDLFPGDSIVNMTDTWFDDEADVLIDNGLPPFTGRFRPQHALSAFDTMNAQGTWTLRVIDRFYLDSGSLDAWAIEINPPLVLTGTVRNRTTQLPLPQVKVEALPTQSATFTNGSGIYGFEQLAVGTYDLRFTKALYDTVVVSGVTVVEGQQTVVDTSLSAPVLFYDFPSIAPPASIPDADLTGAQMTINVAENIRISDLDVTVNLTHTWIGDVSLYLISPLADTIQLVFVGAECLDLGANMTNTRFDDEAALPFSSGQGPFTGSWRPYDSLSAFDSTMALGTWTLRAIDNCELDVGTIQNFTVHIQVGALSVDDPILLYPLSFILSSYPNPFNSATQLRFTLPRDAWTELEIFDITGRLVTSLTHDFLNAGDHVVNFDAGGLPSGIYVAHLNALAQSQSLKLLLLK